MKNEIFAAGDRLRLTVASTVVAGDPVAVGQIVGVAETDYSATDAKASIKTTGVFTLSVAAINGSGNSAVAVGDIIYLVSGDTPVLSKKTTGVRFGYALEAITSGSTATIRVKVGV